ncbi:hypothetical protein GW17_00022508 [Ensete ventricosum]|nr:hypothetical protein GW17_00022508 [Ensete ventricosum]
MAKLTFILVEALKVLSSFEKKWSGVRARKNPLILGYSGGTCTYPVEEGCTTVLNGCDVFSLTIGKLQLRPSETVGEDSRRKKKSASPQVITVLAANARSSIADERVEGGTLPYANTPKCKCTIENLDKNTDSCDDANAHSITPKAPALFGLKVSLVGAMYVRQGDDNLHKPVEVPS